MSTTDDDSPGFTVAESGGSTSVSETGTTDTFTLVLDAEPTTDVVLTVTSGDTGEASLRPASLTFTNANWNSAQTVTVTGVDDVLVDGTQTTTVTVSVDDASDDTFDPLADQTLSVSTADDDSPGFTVAESGGTSVSETGTTDTFTLVLDAQPTTDVVLTVASGDTGEATLSPASVTFTNANWNTAQTVTVTGVDDALIDGTQTTTLTVSVDDATSDDTFDPLADQTVSVSTADDDSPGFTVAESGGSTSVSETGTTDTVTLVLDAEPTTDVVLTVTSGDTGEATLSPASLTFRNANWNTAQTVTVTGVDDVLVDGTQTTTLTVSVDDASSNDTFDPLADQTVSVSTADDDSPGFTVAESDGSTTVSETGTTDTFTLVLDAEPTTDVMLTVTSGDTDEATLSPVSVTFTNANWNTAQTVTGVDDALIDGTQTTTATVSVDDAGSDDAFDPLADQTVSVSTTDDDSPGFTVAESGGTTAVSETGTTDTVTLVLDAQPTTNVVLTVTSGDTGEATVSPASVTFTNANWNTAQTVTVTGVDDALIDGTQTTMVTVSVDDATSDDAFDPLADQTLSVSTADDDSPGFTVAESGGSTSVSETGTTDTFTLVLDAEPTTDVVLTVTSGDTGEATLSPASVTFTNGNWNTAQTVTVTGVDDALIDGTQTTTLTVSVDDATSDDAFDPLADQTVSVSTTEPVVTALTGADLSLTKTHTGTLTQGAEGVTYTLLVTNNGPGPSDGAVTVTDILPDGLTPAGVSGDGWDCAIDGQTAECTRSDALEPGSSYAAIDLTVNVAFTAPLRITNEAQLEGGGDVTPVNNEASDVADVAEAHDEIAFVKTHVGDFVRGQLEAEFVLLVSNIGNGPASGSTRIVDDVPDILTVQDAGGDGWQCHIAGQVVTCTRDDDLPALESFPPLIITVFVPPDAPDSIVNAATLNGTIVDQDIVVFSPPVDIVDPVPVDMQVTKEVDQPMLKIGDEPIFTLGIGNPSQFVLGGVALLDTLPPGFILVPGSGVMRTTGPRLEDLIPQRSTIAPALGGTSVGEPGVPDSTVTTSIEPAFVDGDLLFSIGQLTPGSRVEIDYLTVVGASARPGIFETTVVGTAVSPLGERVTTVPVEVQVMVAGSSFSLTRLLIGRVFEDTNRSGTFDSGEPGIANVRVVTASGLSATTDALGQYNLPSLAAGSTLIAVDPSTIPDGFSLPDDEGRLSGAGQLIRTPLQGGSLLRQNFGLVRSSSSVVRAAPSAPAGTEDVPDADDRSGAPAVTLNIELQRNSMTAGGRDRQLVIVTALDEAGEPASETHLLLSTTLGMLTPPLSSAAPACSPHASAEEQPALFRQADLVTRSGVAYACLISGAVPGDARVDVVDLGDDTLMASADVGFDIESRPPILIALGEVGVGLSSPATGSTLDSERVDGQATLFYQDSFSTDDLITVAVRSKGSVNRATGSSGLFELDPVDRVYPVMGDASTRMELAQSNSHLFARYDRGRSYALFGDLRGDRASLDRSGLLEFSRNVTGFRVHLESQQSGNWFQGQVSRPRTAYTREVVTALVGSAIRLSHPQVVPGTEVVTIEVRDRRNPERTLSRETLARNIDYSLEVDSGLLLLKRRLPLFEQTLALVDVVVTYEYETSGLDSTVYLSRGSISLDAIGLTLGGSVMVQNEGGSQFGVGGVEVEQHLIGTGMLRAAMPVSRGSLPRDSNYSFGMVPGACCESARDRDGTALRIELEQPLFNRAIVVRGRYASTDEDFLNPYGQVTVPGQRFGSVSVDTQVAGMTRFTIGFEAESNRNSLVDNTRQTVGARVEHQVSDILVARAGLDGRLFDDRTTARTVTSRLLSAGLDWSPVERLRTSITREQNLGAADPTYPNQTTLGAQVTMTPGNALYLTQRFSSAPIIPISGIEAGGLASSPLSTRETAIGVTSAFGSVHESQ